MREIGRNGFNIAIASGKGGTGKTTVAVHLAAALAERWKTVQYLDCDVEVPNGHLFLEPRIDRADPVTVPVAVVDAEACSACGKCARVCAFNAIAVLQTALVFPELCHGCGGCLAVCPHGAIREEPRPIGVVESGRAGRIVFTQGRLRIGERTTPTLIRAVKRTRTEGAVAVLDAPPGTACPVVATVRDADYVALVTEPTPFGLYDLRLAVTLMRSLQRRFGVILNRADLGDDKVQAYCAAEHIPLLTAIPDLRDLAEAGSRGAMAGDIPAFKAALAELVAVLEREMKESSPACVRGQARSGALHPSPAP
jgi:MinD superfamily P-loop ATPase